MGTRGRRKDDNGQQRLGMALIHLRKSIRERRLPGAEIRPTQTAQLETGLSFSKPIFFNTAMKRGSERRASQVGSTFNSGSQGVRSSAAFSSQSKASELAPARASASAII